MFYVIMGVSGCGKTTVGQRLAAQLFIPFNDADDFHSTDNKTKMNQGVPLTDEDRLPWLVSIHNHIKRCVDSCQEGIVTCSALKKKYRTILLTGNSPTETTSSLKDSVTFIYLKGSPSVIRDRLTKRTNHFMPAELLDSQFSTLEEPDDTERHIVVNIDNNDVETTVHEIIMALHK